MEVVVGPVTFLCESRPLTYFAVCWAPICSMKEGRLLVSFQLLSPEIIIQKMN